MSAKYSPGRLEIIAHRMMPIEQSASLDALLQSIQCSPGLAERVRQYGSSYRSKSAFIDSAGSLWTGVFLAAGIVIPPFTSVYGLAATQDIPQYLTIYTVIGALGIALSIRAKELRDYFVDSAYNDYRTLVFDDIKSNAPEHLNDAENILPDKHPRPHQ